MGVKAIYKTKATATGGRDGAARSEDGSVDVKLVVPKEMGGPGGEGANPEKLFAAGYSACFLGAMKAVSGERPFSADFRFWMSRATASLSCNSIGPSTLGMTR